MAAPTTALTGDDLLQALSASMVELHERYHGRTPATGRSQRIGDDVLTCVVGGTDAEVEQTLLELRGQPIIQETRSRFQDAMQHRFIDVVQRLSGRRVLAFISNHHAGADVEVECFVLAATDDNAATDGGDGEGHTLN